MAGWVHLHAVKKGKTHVLEWRLSEEAELRDVLPARWALWPGAPRLTWEMALSYVFLWGLREGGPVFVHHQEWDLERADLAGGVWRRPESDLAWVVARLATCEIRWELTGRLIGGRGSLAVRTWWEPRPMLLAAPADWASLVEALAAVAGRDAVARTVWFYPTEAGVTVQDMGQRIDERGEAGAPPWPLPMGCALVAYAEHGQDEGYGSAVQFVCKNAAARDRVLRRAADYRQFLQALVEMDPPGQAALVEQWVEQAAAPAVAPAVPTLEPRQGPGSDSESPPSA